MSDQRHVVPSAFKLEFVFDQVILGGFRRIALQFPDELLCWAPLVSAELSSLLAQQQREPRSLVFVLGDTSYGSCCVDEVAAEHLAADVVVHFGHACLSATRKLPVIYVLMDHKLEQHVSLPSASQILDVALQGRSKTQSTAGHRQGTAVVTLLYDITLHDQIHSSDLCSNPEIAIAAPVVDVSTTVYPGSSGTDDTTVKRNSKTGGALKYCTDTSLYIWFTHGTEFSTAVRNFLLLGASDGGTGLLEKTGFIDVTTSSEVCWIHDDSGSAGNIPLTNVYRLLSKRYAVEETIRQAERIGILIGTLAVSGLVEVADRCRDVIVSAGKRPYRVLVGKPNPAKLANFPDIDVFVLLACPENSLLANSKEYYQTVVTPLELEIALAGGSWVDQPYDVDFSHLQDNVVSTKDEKAGQEIAVRPRMEVSRSVLDGAASFLTRRSWQGLNPTGRGTPAEPTKAEEGRDGTASGYLGEGTK